MSIDKISGNTTGIDVANRIKDVSSDNNINKTTLNQDVSLNKDEFKVSSEFNAIQDAVSKLAASDAPVDSAKVSQAIQDLNSRDLGSLSNDPKIQLDTANRIADSIFGDI